VSGARAVFVDRDGVINELAPDPATGAPESPLRPDDVRLIDGAADALARLRDAGWMLVGVSNQPAAAKGTIPLAQLYAVQDRVLALVDQAAGVHFDGFELCLHHPEGIVAELSGPCDCRKPEPGMLRTAAARLGIDLPASWMVGDTDADLAAGHAAGCATILIEHPASAHKRAGRAAPSPPAADLAGAADMILHRKG
jgi:D-glycero-D-manno-heptose 1,7-bisphosphate phosphatase